MRFTIGVMRKFGPADGFILEATEINGATGFLLRTRDGLHSVLTMEFDGGRISAIYLVRNPEKLTRVNRLSSAGSSPSA